MWIDTHPLADQHPRVSQTEDSANPLHPTPISDLCEKFSSISSPVIPLITSFESSKCASPLNEPRVPQKLVSSVDLAGNEESVDRHNQQCRSTPAATQPGTVYTPPWKARLQQKSSTTLFTSWTPSSQAIDSKQALSGRQPIGLNFFFFSFLLFLIYFSRSFWIWMPLGTVSFKSGGGAYSYCFFFCFLLFFVFEFIETLFFLYVLN